MKNDLAILIKEQERYEEIEPLLHYTVEGRCIKVGDAHPYTLEARDHLINLYEDWDKSEKANEWRAKTAQTEAEVE